MRNPLLKLFEKMIFRLLFYQMIAQNARSKKPYIKIGWQSKSRIVLAKRL
jgi:hypothetical protein